MSEAGPSIPGVKHKVIALLSGGKDSCFNLLHCEATGHEVVAIATLTPEEGVDELDSHLYQSVGTRLLPFIARAAGLPLHTRVIRGRAVELGPEYGSRSGGIGKGKGKGKEGDETEDLYALLQEVMASLLKALAADEAYGVESAPRCDGPLVRRHLVQLPAPAHRARLLPPRPRVARLPLATAPAAPPLLHAGVRHGGRACQSGRCGPERQARRAAAGPSHAPPHEAGALSVLYGAASRVADRQEQLYGSHPAGEGGEYETITLSSPLWSHRLVLKDTEVVITDPGEYPVAYLKVNHAELEEKQGWTRPSVQQLRDMLRLPSPTSEPLDGSGLEDDEHPLLGTEPACLDDVSRRIYEQALLAAQTQNDSAAEAESSLMALERLRLDRSVSSPLNGEPKASLSRRGRWVVATIDGHCSTDDEPIDSEIKRAFDTLSSALDAAGLSLSVHAAHITFLLSSMSLFAPANAVYASYFGVSPPSRATVAVPLPSNQRIRLEVVCFDDRLDLRHANVQAKIGGRQALHVQGLSYWAPANIGPYSQAVVVNSRVHLAGQIPLNPASLTLPVPSPGISPYPLQAALALQHVRRVLDLLRSKQSTGGGWDGWCESAIAWWATPPGEPSTDGNTIMRAAWDAFEPSSEAPVVFVQAAELPRGALVEYQVDMHTGRPGVTAGSSGDDDEDEDDDLQPVYEHIVSDKLRWEVCSTSRPGQGSRAMLFFAGPPADGDVAKTIKVFMDKSAVGIKLYRTYQGAEAYNADELAKHLLPDLATLHCTATPCETLVPVLSIFDRTGRRWPVVMEIFGA